MFVWLQIAATVDVFKPKSLSAYIACIGPVHKSTAFYLVAEKELLVRLRELDDAVLLWLMLHYIFWLEYPPQC